jgi:hypothetical protein
MIFWIAVLIFSLTGWVWTHALTKAAAKLSLVVPPEQTAEEFLENLSAAKQDHYLAKLEEEVRCL